MSDPIARLLREHADSLDDPVLPDFGALRARARRRQRTRNLAGVTLVAAAVAAVATVTALAGTGPAATPVAAPPGTTTVVTSGSLANAGRTSTAPMSTTTGPVATTNEPPSKTTVADGAQLRVGQAMYELGQRDPKFAGIGNEDTNSGPGVIVYQKAGGDSSLYPRSLDGVPVRVAAVQVSQAEATQIIGRILAARKALAAQGIDVIAAGFNSERVTVRIPKPQNWMTPKIAAAANVDPDVLVLIGGEVGPDDLVLRPTT